MQTATPIIKLQSGSDKIFRYLSFIALMLLVTTVHNANVVATEKISDSLAVKNVNGTLKPVDVLPLKRARTEDEASKNLTGTATKADSLIVPLQSVRSTGIKRMLHLPVAHSPATTTFASIEAHNNRESFKQVFDEPMRYLSPPFNGTTTQTSSSLSLEQRDNKRTNPMGTFRRIPVALEGSFDNIARNRATSDKLLPETQQQWQPTTNSIHPALVTTSMKVLSGLSSKQKQQPLSSSEDSSYSFLRRFKRYSLETLSELKSSDSNAKLTSRGRGLSAGVAGGAVKMGDGGFGGKVIKKKAKKLLKKARKKVKKTKKKVKNKMHKFKHKIHHQAHDKIHASHHGK